MLCVGRWLPGLIDICLGDGSGEGFAFFGIDSSVTSAFAVVAVSSCWRLPGRETVGVPTIVGVAGSLLSPVSECISECTCGEPFGS